MKTVHADVNDGPFLQVKEITSMYASDVSRWTAEALTALQEVRHFLLPESNMDIVLVVSFYL